MTIRLLAIALALALPFAGPAAAVAGHLGSFELAPGEVVTLTVTLPGTPDGSLISFGFAGHHDVYIHEAHEGIEPGNHIFWWGTATLDDGSDFFRANPFLWNAGSWSFVFENSGDRTRHFQISVHPGHW